MKRIALLGLAFFLFTGRVGAQDSFRTEIDDAVLPVPATVETSELSYTQSASRYEDPKTAVRRNAEYRATQRRSRIAATSWLNESKLRPEVFTPPWYSYTSNSPWAVHPYVPSSWFGGGYYSPWRVSDSIIGVPLARKQYYWGNGN
ncbi:MAG: hypothetical protein R3E01_26415 [Pirellulaceae bacterium]|nr:hypothetical protein [Planctomycetales bacterium]